MERTDIKGFTLKILNYNIEFVFVKYLLNSISCSKPLNRTIWRVE